MNALFPRFPCYSYVCQGLRIVQVSRVDISKVGNISCDDNERYVEMEVDKVSRQRRESKVERISSAWLKVGFTHSTRRCRKRHYTHCLMNVAQLDF